MKKTDVNLYGITYTVHATTDKGLRDGIRELKKSLKRMMDEENKDEE